MSLKIGDSVRCVFGGVGGFGGATFGKTGTITYVGHERVNVKWDDGSSTYTSWEFQSSFEVLPSPKQSDTKEEKPELGDTVEVSIEMSDSTVTLEATYLGINESSSGDDFDTVYLKESWLGYPKCNIYGAPIDYSNQSWSASTKQKDQKFIDQIKQLGLSPSAECCWYVSGKQSKITKILNRKGKDKEMVGTVGNVDHKSLKAGDRVLVQLKDQNGFTYDVKATILCYDPSSYETHVYFDESISFANTLGNSWIPPQAIPAALAQAKALGLDITKPNAFKIGDGVNGSNFIKHARFTQILSRVADTKVADKEKGKDKDMTTEKKEALGFMETLKADAEKGAWRAGATALADSAQAGILLALKANTKMEDSKMEVVAELLKTEGGNALIRSILGYTLTYAPGIKDMDPRVAKLAEEFRVSGMQVGMEGIVSMLQQYLAPAVAHALGNLPPIQEVLPAEVRQAVRRTRKRVAHADKARIASTPAPEPETLSAQEDSPETKQQAASV